MSPRHTAGALLPGLAAALILSLPGCDAQDNPAAPSAPAPATPVPAAPAGPPLAPVNLTAAPSGQGVIELRWNAPPADPARQPVTGYRIEWSGDGNTDWTPVEPAHTGAETSYRHTGLTPETTRHYRVFATSAGGDSPASVVAVATTAPAGPPLAPVNLTAVPNGQGVIELRWNAPPAGPARQPVTGYRIEWSGDGNTNWTPVEPAHTGAATSYLHTGLTPSTTLHYRVFAISAGGDSPASTVAVATTGEAVPPLAPVNLTAAPDGEGVIELRWNAPPADPARQPVTGYRIEWSGDGNTNWTPVEPAHTGTATSYLHTGLTPEITLHYRVFATSAGGDSPASNAVVATTGEVIAVTTLEFVEETVTIREGETRAIGIRYRIAELAAPLPVRISVLPSDAGPADYELSEGRFEVPAGSGVNGSVEVSLGAQTDRAFAEGDEELLLRLVAGTGARAEVGADLRVVIADVPVSPCAGVVLGGTPPEPTETAGRIRTSLTSEWSRSADGVTMAWANPYGRRLEWLGDDGLGQYADEAEPLPPQPDFHVESWRIVPGASSTTHLMDVQWSSGLDLELMFGCDARQVVAVCRRQGCELAP